MIIMLGDIHGRFYDIECLIQSYQISDCTMIQVGDFGAADIPSRVRRISEFDFFLKERNITMYAIRGNHDDPEFFNGNWMLDNLKLLPDYTVLNLEGQNFLFIGGATSIDRKNSLKLMQEDASYGVNNPRYWFNEKVNYDKEKLQSIKDIDIIVTHTSPDYCHPINKLGFGQLVEHFAQNDPTLIEELKEERIIMTQIFNDLKAKNNIKKHFYGHFHRSFIESLDMEHILLGINELKMV